MYAPHLGGVETHVAQISKQLVKNGDHVTILTTQSSPEMPLQELLDGVTVKRLPFPYINQKLATWRWLWQQRALWQAADSIQVHDIFWWLYPFYPFISSKVFTTFHGWEGQYPIPLKNKLQRWLISKLSRATIHVGAWIQEFYWDKPNVVVYGGVTGNQATDAPKKQTQKTPIIIFVGRLVAENEITHYLELVKILKKVWPDLTVKWLGDGEYHLACSKAGTVIGMVKNPTHYLASANFVFANSYLSILDAQLQGKVVIGMYGNRLKARYLETFPGNRAMCIGGEPAVMAERMIDIWHNSDTFKKMCNEAQQFAQTQSWEKVVTVYQKIWHNFN